MEELLQYLNSVHPLSKGLQEYLVEIIKTKTLPKKTFLLKAGHTSRNICFISKGLLRAFYVKNDEEVSSWFMKEGDIIVSIESFYDQTQSYESIQAIEETQVLYICYDELELIYQKYPEFNFIGRVLTIQYLTRWAKQLYSIRMQTASERYQWLVTHHPELVLRVPAKFIASYLDINEVTLSKIKGKKLNDKN
ncbi:MAG TPA: Crp/Fnr family transcriptional regulator [Puia sp.]|nr:Crp/Fnr family transcriptional regulator [Puia sp.]